MKSHIWKIFEIRFLEKKKKKRKRKTDHLELMNVFNFIFLKKNLTT
jgi:hypothetical protein